MIRKKRRGNPVRCAIIWLVIFSVFGLGAWQRKALISLWGDASRILHVEDVGAALRLTHEDQFGLICPPSGCFVFGHDGIVAGHARVVVGDILIRIDDPAGTDPAAGTLLMDQPSWANLKPILEAVRRKEISAPTIRLARASNELFIQSVRDDGSSVPFYFSLDFDPAEQLRALSAFLKQAPLSTLEYADFRVKGRIFYKQLPK